MINKQESKYWESLLSSQMHIILVITSNMLWNPTKCQILESKSSSFMMIIIIIIEILQLSAFFFSCAHEKNKFHIFWNYVKII